MTDEIEQLSDDEIAHLAETDIAAVVRAYHEGKLARFLRESTPVREWTTVAEVSP